MQEELVATGNKGKIDTSVPSNESGKISSNLRIGIRDGEPRLETIEVDKKILDNASTSPQQRRHIEGELHELEVYVENHKEEIAAGDHHDPTALELYCEMEPEADECRVYED